MGSGSKRKDNDTVRINRLRSVGTGAASGSGKQEDINHVCPPGFRISITLVRAMPDGTPVDIQDSDQLFIHGEFVGVIPTTRKKMINRCADSGIHYAAVVVNEEEQAYAKFEQS